jgi:hypothetical protein
VFADTATLLGINPDRPLTVKAGQSVDFQTRWLARDAAGSPRRIFVHLVDPALGKIIAQHDGLDAPPRFWQAGDWIAQQHVLSITNDTPAGVYELRIGLYDPNTGQRILQTNYNHTQPPSEYVVLGTIEVTR